jgi:transposase
MRPDPDLLQQWVLVEGVRAAEVGARLGLSRAAGYAWLRRYAISAGGPVLPQDRLAGMWRAGLLATRIAAEHGLPPDAVRERLVAAAVLVPDRSYFTVGSPEDPLPESLLRDWVIREGFTVAQVATVTGTTPRQVRYRLARYQISPGRPGPRPRLRRSLTREALVKMYVYDGLSCPRIAERAGVSAESVRELLVEYGIPRRPSGSRERPPLHPAALDDYAQGRITLPELATRLGYVTPSGNPAVRRLRSALRTSPLAQAVLVRDSGEPSVLDRARSACATATDLVAWSTRLLEATSARRLRRSTPPPAWGAPRHPDRAASPQPARCPGAPATDR